MIIDCDGCLARGPACQDCVVTVVLGPEAAAHPARPSGQDAPWPPHEEEEGAERVPDHAQAGRHLHGRRFPVPVLVSGPRLPVRGSGQVDLDAAERAAIAVLSSSGLVPPLRAVPGPAGPAGPAEQGGSRPSAHAG